MNRFLFAILFLLTAPAAVFAQPQALTVTVCPAVGSETALPDFNALSCEEQPIWSVDPQERALWIRGHIDIPDSMTNTSAPLGLYVSGKMSSRIWFNGEYLGENGVPATSTEDERPGLMDAAFYLPRDLVSAGDNQVTLLVSAHHGVLRFTNPVHWIAIGEYGDPRLLLMTNYWPTAITFGAFVLAFIFFSIAALRGMERSRSLQLAAFSVIAAIQLIAEIARGLFAYPFPLHEVRMLVIAGCSALLGLVLIAYLLTRYSGWRWRVRLGVLACLAALEGGALYFSGGYDEKSGYSLLMAMLLGMALSLYWTYRGHRACGLWAGALGLAIALLFLEGGAFLDRYVFYLAGSMLLVLVGVHAQIFARERTLRQAATLRARQLETALDQARQRTEPAQLSLTEAGRVERVSTDRIVHLKGAGDYVEISFEDGRTRLYNGTLNGLEADLPSTFLRVHRSHIVNTDFVKSLTRDSSGIGRLTLTTGSEIPVSRRILPSVRSVLAGHPAPG